MFHYNAAQTTFKWEFVGGAPAYSAVETSQTTSERWIRRPATVGPSFTVPRAGDYLFRYNVDVGNSGAGNIDIVGLMKNGVEADRLCNRSAARAAGGPDARDSANRAGRERRFQAPGTGIPEAATDRYPDP
jgi:hypothetical protein